MQYRKNVPFSTKVLWELKKVGRLKQRRFFYFLEGRKKKMTIEELVCVLALGIFAVIFIVGAILFFWSMTKW